VALNQAVAAANAWIDPTPIGTASRTT